MNDDAMNDATRIAALLDGRLDAPERAALLARLEASTDGIGVLSDAIVAQSEESALSRASTHTVHWTRRRSVHWALAAAVVAAIAAPSLWRMRSAPMPSADAVAAQLQRTEHGLAAVEFSWPDTRGGEQAISQRARAIRVGAQFVDLSLLLQVRDTAAARVARQISALLADAPAGSQAREAAAAIASNVAEATAAQLRNAIDLAEGVVGRDEARVGAWLEGERIAAAQHDAVSLRATASPRAVRAALRTTDAPGVDGTDVVILIGLVESRSSDWPRIERAASESLRRLGR